MNQLTDPGTLANLHAGLGRDVKPEGARYRETYRAAGWSARVWLCSGEFTPISSPRDSLATAAILRALNDAFLRHRGIYQSDVGWLLHPSLNGSHRLPPMAPHPGPRTRPEDHALLIVPMSSDRLFLDRVGRHQSPSPLHRHGQTNTGFLDAPRNRTFLLCQEADISTLP
jgi:hypothetical protein